MAEEKVRLNELASSEDPEDVEAVTRLNAELAQGQEASAHLKQTGIDAHERLDEGDLAEADEEELGGRR